MVIDDLTIHTLTFDDSAEKIYATVSIPGLNQFRVSLPQQNFKELVLEAARPMLMKARDSINEVLGETPDVIMRRVK